MKLFLPALLFAVSSFAQEADPAKLKTALDRAERTLKDWANLGRYREANATTPAPAAGEDRVDGLCLTGSGSKFVADKLGAAAVMGAK